MQRKRDVARNKDKDITVVKSKDSNCRVKTRKDKPQLCLFLLLHYFTKTWKLT